MEKYVHTYVHFKFEEKPRNPMWPRDDVEVPHEIGLQLVARCGMVFA